MGIFQFFASYSKAKVVADAATTDTLPIDLGFALSDDNNSVRMTLAFSGGEGPFAERALMPTDLDDLIA